MTDGQQFQRPKAVALDIDGTLIDHDEGMSPAVLDAVHRTAAQVPVILATGRAWSTTKPVAQRLRLPAGGFVVCSNERRHRQRRRHDRRSNQSHVAPAFRIAR